MVCWYTVFGDLLVGYGYSPWHAFLISLLAIGIGARLFKSGYRHGLITPTDHNAYCNEISETGQRQISETYPKFNAFIYSLETFVPLLNLAIGDYWIPNAKRGTELPVFRKLMLQPIFGKRGAEMRMGNKPAPTTGAVLRWYLWIHIIAGWVLTTLWVGGLTGLLKT
jgi:hypothetical protein